VTVNSEASVTYTMPMLVIQNSTQVEIRDCYLRAIRKDMPPSIPFEEDLQKV